MANSPNNGGWAENRANFFGGKGGGDHWKWTDSDGLVWRIKFPGDGTIKREWFGEQTGNGAPSSGDHPHRVEVASVDDNTSWVVEYFRSSGSARDRHLVTVDQNVETGRSILSRLSEVRSDFSKSELETVKALQREFKELSPSARLELGERRGGAHESFNQYFERRKAFLENATVEREAKKKEWEERQRQNAARAVERQREHASRQAERDRKQSEWQARQAARSSRPSSTRSGVQVKSFVDHLFGTPKKKKW
jgi:hypothetical protein